MARRRFKLLPRYRRPSMKTLLGVTRAKRRLGASTGYYRATRWTRWPRNARRRVLRRVGCYSGPMMFVRWLRRKFR
jgi:hypothetical protein